jgi:hypothetical protein
MKSSKLPIQSAPVKRTPINNSILNKNGIEASILPEFLPDYPCTCKEKGLPIIYA